MGISFLGLVMKQWIHKFDAKSADSALTQDEKVTNHMYTAISFTHLILWDTHDHHIASRNTFAWGFRNWLCDSLGFLS